MFILLVGIVDVIYLTGRGVTETRDSTNAVIATMLAQEGVEMVRNIRDNNVTEMTCGANENERCTAFGKYFPRTSSSAINAYCTAYVDASVAADPLACSGASRNEDLFINEDTGLYTHTSGKSTTLKRRVYITYTMTNDELFGDVTNPHVAADVTSIVVFGGKKFEDFKDATPDTVASWCTIGKNCVFAQTRLTSWLNYE